MQAKYISKNGEVVDKDTLISEIESLLNNKSALADSHLNQTLLSREIMSVLEIEELENIRDGLLHKQGKEIESNKEWLFGLSQGE
ncbi:hypothetical protein CQA49_03635 [Helicobacter sp. MIT 00-7814]|uniref:hypothetical protein n=1 Tax=unclassified Helicobacter TaxID=2593540 RepID=UPI000E1E6FD3|nr:MULTISPECIES: hypothetical protein [unclassified Helicobacter]RDU53047.1 hypothetical protein CQA37_07645 [Helicobacter sp. MIT 99-10781]RDU55310.1 hypothetical protein CQA49_03635 [Helicobacter sp. MIT 00-7814]